MKVDAGYWLGNQAFISLESESSYEAKLLKAIGERGVHLQSFGALLGGKVRLTIEEWKMSSSEAVKEASKILRKQIKKQ